MAIEPDKGCYGFGSYTWKYHYSTLTRDERAELLRFHRYAGQSDEVRKHITRSLAMYIATNMNSNEV